MSPFACIWGSATPPLLCWIFSVVAVSWKGRRDSMLEFQWLELIINMLLSFSNCGRFG